MASRQISRADLQDCLERMNDYQRRVFAAAPSEQQRQILLAMLRTAVSPVSAQSSPQSSLDDDDDDDDDDDESVVTAMLRTTSMCRTDTNLTEWSQHAMDSEDVQLMTPVSPTSNNQPRGQYICLQRGCGAAFYRHGDLHRHTESKHNPNRKRYNCPVEGCNRVGSNGLPRPDKVLDHMRDKHKIPLPKTRKGESRKSSW